MILVNFSKLIFFCITCFLCFTSIAADRHLIERQSNSTLVVFVHGFTGDYIKTWGEFPKLLANDKELTKVDFLFWGYPSKMFGINESIGTIGQHLKTEIDYLPSNKYKKIVLIAHSMGGLVVRSYIVQALIDGKGKDLKHIRNIVLFGVPNEGIDKANYLPSIINDQIADLKTASSFIVKLRKYWIQRVTTAQSNNEYKRKIPVTSIAGYKDNFVPKQSVLSYFDSTEVTDGNHTTMVKPQKVSHLSYRIVKAKILKTLNSKQASDSVNNLSFKKRRVIEDQLRKVIKELKTTADTICTAVGSIDATPWKRFSQWLVSSAMLYVEPQAAEQLVMSSSYIDSVSSSTYEASRAVLNDIQSNAKLYLPNNKKETSVQLAALDRSYQALTEILLFELGESKYPKDTPFGTRINNLRWDKRNTWYCDDTKYQKSTTQKLGR